MIRDPEPPSYWLIVVAVVFGVSVLPGLGLMTLSVGEAHWGLAVRSLLATGDWVTARPAGSTMIDLPLQTWLGAAVVKFLGLSDWSLRLVGLLPVLGLAALCGWVARQCTDWKGAAIAVTVVLFSLPTMEAGIQGYGRSLFTLLMNGAWLTWFYFSRENKRWFYAWFCSLGLVGLAIMVAGLIPVLYFYVPLMFLRRPLKPFRRLAQWQHWAGLSVLTAAVVVWLALAPGYWNLDVFFATSEPSMAYIPRLILLPILGLVAYLPWVFVTWPAYCAAFTPLEPYRVLGRYLRTIFWSVVVLACLLPGGSLAYLQPLVGPLAILTAMHYPNLMRRYARPMLLLPRVLSLVAIGLVSLGFGQLVLMQFGVLEDVATPSMTKFSAVALAGALILAFISIGMRERWPLWMVVMLGMAAIQLVRLGAVQAFDKARSEEVQAVQAFRDAVPGDAPIFLNPDELKLGPVHAWYLQHDLIEMTTTYDVYGGETVYVLQGNNTPQNGFRHWTRPADPVTLDGQRMALWEGKRHSVSASTTPANDSTQPPSPDGPPSTDTPPGAPQP